MTDRFSTFKRLWSQLFATFNHDYIFISFVMLSISLSSNVKKTVIFYTLVKFDHNKHNNDIISYIKIFKAQVLKTQAFYYKRFISLELLT